MEIVSVRGSGNSSTTNKTNNLRLTQSQFGLMVDYMMLNPELARGKTIKNSVVWQDKWVELAHLLNSNGAGPRKSVDRRRKSWSDLKSKIRNKVKNEKSSSITEIEQKAWSLIKPYDADDLRRKKNSDNCVSEVDKGVNHLQKVEESRYYILTLGNISQLDPNLNSKNNSAKVGDADSEKSKEVSEEISENSNGTSEKKEAESDAKRESKTKCSSILTAGGNSEKGYIQYKAFAPVIQDLSKSIPRKRIRIQNCETVKESIEEIGVIPLLQRQNEMLEKITQTLIRIEKSFEASSSQTTNGAINTIAENIDKMATCLSSVSTSLKSVAK